MITEYFLTRVESVMFTIATQPQEKGFVHTNVNTIGTETVAAGTNHGLNKFVGLFLTAQKNILGVLNVVEALPTQRGRQMRQGLNTGDHFDTITCGIGIQFLQLTLGVTTTHITEIGILRHFVCILGV